MSEATGTPAPPPGAVGSEKPKPKRTARDLFEGLGIALLMAVFYKYFAVEAYQIPTSSMQPTMMGSDVAKVYDRLIVDKLRYAIVDPDQWDIAVFKYPIRQNQNYVKRIVGMPGMKLRFAGGNVYEVTSGDGSKPEHLSVCRKPDVLQSSLWKEVFPARMNLDGGSTALDQYFVGRGGQWTERDGEFTGKPRNSNSLVRLSFRERSGTGMANELWDGYPAEVAKKIRANALEVRAQRGMERVVRVVQDARLAFRIETQKTPSEFEVELSIEAPGADGKKAIHRRVLRCENGNAFVFAERDKQQLAKTDAKPLDIGAAPEICFEYFDDLLRVSVDGDAFAELDCADHKILANASFVTPSIRVSGDGGEVKIRDVTVHRDLHYVASTRLGTDDSVFPVPEEDAVIQVPEGHYMMLGDNTLQSVDSRDWTAITIGVEDGRVVDPDLHPDAKRLSGNLRPVTLTERPDPDENPVVIAEQGKVVFTDDAGEVHTLEGQAHLEAATEGSMWGRDGAWFQDADGNPWHPTTELVRFVPREHVIGRPVLNFWPVYGPFRVGLIR